MPTFNPVPEHLREALTCIRNQTERDWHAVIHDDASTVDVRAIVAPFLADPRFTFIRSDRRRGIGGNWNACLQHVKARIVQFLFQDDLWEPAYLEKGLAILEAHPEVGLVSIDHDYRTESGSANAAYYQELNAFKHAHIPVGEHSGEDVLRLWLKHDLKPGLLGEPSFVMIRRYMVERAGTFLEDMPQSLDNEYWIRCLPTTRWYYLREPLGTFRVHAQGASALNDLAGAGLTDRLRIYQILLAELSKTHALRKDTEQSARRALSAMIRKYCTRRASGKKVTLTGGGKKTVMAFMMRHPLLTFGALMRKEMT
ncbi:MAG: glycosyltransferase family 2 protein [Candidatus Peribacteraceae bacterium]|nr:glycosyltransferase family 2 protein [Candidatus Peribacteraceae bacterium]